MSDSQSNDASVWGPPTVGGEPVELTLSDSPQDSAPKRSRGRTFGVIAGVGALIAAGTFAVVSIAGNSNSGGADNPEAVGRELFTALGNEDVLGVIDLLLPGERETFRQPLIDWIGNLRRLTVLDDQASLSQVGGFDLTFSDVTVREEATNVSDISNIFLNGSATTSIDGDKVPIGELLIEQAFDGKRPDMTQEEQTSPMDGTKLTVVERDGRWYLSAFYSLAEGARGDQDIPATGIEPRGAATPELAVDSLLGAISDQKLSDAIAVLDPSEAEALQRYAPMFIGDAQQALDDAGIIWAITDRTYTVRGSGSRRSVGIASLTFAASTGDLFSSDGSDGTIGSSGPGNITITYSDGCVTAEADGEKTTSCTSDDPDLAGLADQLGLDDSSALQALYDSGNAAFADYRSSDITVHQVDGAWYVSPVRSYFDNFNALLAALDRDEIVDLIDKVRAVADSLDLGSLITDTSIIDSGSSELLPDGSGNASSDALSQCYMMNDGATPAATVLSCISDGITAGTIDPTIVSATVRYPECGVAETYLGDVFALSDEEFVTMATTASPCFLGLVADGSIASYEVPYELLAPECLEGRNWYLVSEADYSSRFIDCAEAVRAGL